ncbi:MlaC/ttg2D family ABC transporter substrate-binding protein [Gilvimarinus algae]|uniref:ABC transporter substrate-binding protein n=1 Tax=Gilvimarinus algae TaxID=3058037 RepID=A0ABT8TFS4_9GAMM|nr:ABC transporter substrate-binding protein [Gilvimarinus sp. SDUM040014]MDO3382860.1 ABC transporter substrate-binding protein [Gilvimarinus sp. SDUM040014]
MKNSGFVAVAGRLWVMVLLALPISGVFAQEADPYKVVSQVTDKLVSAARAHNSGGDKAAYDAQVLQALEPVVAFDYIARVVMGDYYKAASEEQRKAFAEKFKTGLVSTYAKGIATYADSDIRVLPASESVGDKRRVTVDQEVKYQGATHKLSYTMGKNREGQWKLINLVLNGANLGSSFSSQFEQLANKYKGDVAKVIDHWDADKA